MVTSTALPRGLGSVYSISGAFRLVACVLLGLTSAGVLHAQPGTGTVIGRVFNPATSSYLERVQVTVEGTSLETFSDEDGNFRLLGVPAGTAKIRAFRTGLPPSVTTVAITAGGTVEHGITMQSYAAAPGAAAAPIAPGGGNIVKLDNFVVNSRTMDGAAIAINEQRFAPDMRTVVAADEFGQVAEANAAEMIKFLPGVAIEYGGGNARNIMLNGAPAGNVPITVGGFDLASAGVGGMGRAVALDMVSINNVSRVEVVQSATPDSPGNALSGSVNLVPRSAFERSRPELVGSVFLLMRDQERSLKKTPGPTHEPRRKVHPGFDFAYTVPVNKRFGFSISANQATQYSPQDWVELTWRGTTGAIDANYAPTTPDKPYLTNFSFRDDAKETGRTSLGFSADFRLSATDRVSVAFQHTQNYVDFFARQFNFNIQRALSRDFGPTFTHGDAGATGTASFGNISVTNNALNRTNRTYMPTLTWRHAGRTWRFEGGAGYSRASNVDRDTDLGFFQGANATRGRLRINFDNISYLRPNDITVRDDNTGALIDPYRLDNKALTTAASNPRDFVDVRRSAMLNASREFNLGVPVALKAGVDVRKMERDARGGTINYTYVGPDGVAAPAPNTPVGNDNTAGPFIDEAFSTRTPAFGFPRVDWLSAAKIYQSSVQNPRYFTTNAIDTYNNFTNTSKHAEERITSAYLRGDISLLERRLKITTGVRAEQTNIDAEGPLNNPTANNQKAANGRPIPGTTIFPAGSLDARKLILTDRGLSTEKEYLRWFPSLNANYAVRENLILRGAYYWSIGRPDFNQYASGVTLPDLTITPDPSTAAGRITVNNVGIKPWKAETIKARAEYYFERVGQVSFGAWRRSYTNFWQTQRVVPTEEFFDNYGIDAATYSAYEFFTQANQPGKYRLTGLEFDYRQSLTFLPTWARGVQVFANVSAIHESGAQLGSTSFAGFIPRIYNWGLSVTRPKYTARINWNYRGRQRLNSVANAGTEPGTYRYATERLYIDVLAEYKFTPRFSLFMNLRNLNDATEDFETYGPNTPQYARLRNITDFHSLWTFGVKGSF
jgi:iron complex outermembrane recepter protein